MRALAPVWPLSNLDDSRYRSRRLSAKLPEVPDDAGPAWFTGTIASLILDDSPEGSRVAPVSRKPPSLPFNHGRAAGVFREVASIQTRLVDEGEVAHGGFSTVRRVYDPRLRRHLALKVLDPELEEARADAITRLLEEAQITGQLDHPNIVPVHDLGGDAEGRPSFSMKLVHGRTLRQAIESRSIEERTARELEDLVTIVLRVCDAIAFAHSRGVIHRDLKPENIMTGSHGQVYVMDWGCALLLGKRESERAGEGTPRVTLQRDANAAALDAPGTIIGTAAYMPPEQAWGRIDEIDERSDVYALGGILYHILTGVPPHRGETMIASLLVAQTGVVLSPDETVGDAADKLPPGLCAIAMKALEADPACRHASVDALRQELESFLRGGGWFAQVVFPAGATIIREGDAGDCAYIIVRGTCEARKTEGDRQVTMRVMGAGEVVGETAVLTAGQRSASVIALEEVTALLVTRDSFERELGTGSWMGVFIRALAGRFRELDTRLMKMRLEAAPPSGG
jgi:eukaryotic-like serine/threonine-protein kinase